MLSRFHLIPERNKQMDKQTDRFAISISRVSELTCDNKTCSKFIILSTRKQPQQVAPFDGSSVGQSP